MAVIYCHPLHHVHHLSLKLLYLKENVTRFHLVEESMFKFSEYFSGEEVGMGQGLGSKAGS